MRLFVGNCVPEITLPCCTGSRDRSCDPDRDQDRKNSDHAMVFFVEGGLVEHRLAQPSALRAIG